MITDLTSWRSRQNQTLIWLTKRGQGWQFRQCRHFQTMLTRPSCAVSDSSIKKTPELCYFTIYYKIVQTNALSPSKAYSRNKAFLTCHEEPLVWQCLFQPFITWDGLMHTNEAWWCPTKLYALTSVTSLNNTLVRFNSGDIAVLLSFYWILQVWVKEEW